MKRLLSNKREGENLRTDQSVEISTKLSKYSTISASTSNSISANTDSDSEANSNSNSNATTTATLLPPTYLT